MAKKTFRPYDPQARGERPGDLRQYLPRDHQVFLIEDLVEALDLTPMTSVYEQGDGRGQPPYHPGLLTKLLLSAYCEGETSARQIMRKTDQDIAYRVLCVDQHPDFRPISDFRERHLSAFVVLFKDTVRFATELGQVRREHVAQDGRKILATASQHKAMSDERMGQTEERLGREIAEILQQAHAVEGAEDARSGPEATGDDRPEALRREVDFRQARQARIRMARAAREARAAAEAAAHHPSPEAPPPAVRLLTPDPESAPAPTSAPPRLTVGPTTAESAPPAQPDTPPAVGPAPKEHDSLTDPDARLMPSSPGFVQAYHGQVAVDHDQQIIVACDVTDAWTDVRRLQPIADQVRQNTGCLPDE